jgi:hypothetical protein
LSRTTRTWHLISPGYRDKPWTDPQGLLR